MSRKAKQLTPAQEDLLRKLARNGVPAREIAQRVSRLGPEPISAATVGRRVAEIVGPQRLGAKGLPKPRRRHPRAKDSVSGPGADERTPDSSDGAPDSPPAPPAPPPPLAPPPAPGTGDEFEEIFRTLRELEREAGGVDGAPGTLAAAIRLRLQTIALREKLRPTPPPDFNESPDFMAAAEACRRKLREMLARELEGSGS